MSESPWSRMAMVEQRKSLPQAVPSSICILNIPKTHPKASQKGTSRSAKTVSLRSRYWGASSQGTESCTDVEYVHVLPENCDRRLDVDVNLHCYPQSGGHCTFPTWSSTRARTSSEEECCLNKYIPLVPRLPTQIEMPQRTGGLPAMMTSLAFPERRDLRVDLYPSTYLPDFITSARRELMESAVFLVFLVGAVFRKY